MRIEVVLLASCCTLGSASVLAGQSSKDAHRKLREQEVIIQALQKRLDALERLVAAGSQAPPPSTVVRRDDRLQTGSRLPSGPGTAPLPSESRLDEAGSFKVEEDETARALERALVREGGFLLPAGSYEIEPRFQYSFRGSRGLGIVSLPSGAQVADRVTRQDRFEGSVGIRAGLPWGSQAEIRLPYVWTRQVGAAAALGVSESESRSGRGDVELQLTKQFSGERKNIPALLGSLTLRTATGQYSPGHLPTGSGFPSLQAGLTAVKRQDPLVFVGGISYTGFSSKDYGGSTMDPGNGVGLRMSTILAASPDTSLRAGLDFSRYGKMKINGVDAPGTDLVSGVIELGLSTLVSPRTLLDLSIGFGVTPDAPNLRIGLSLPIRFD